MRDTPRKKLMLLAKIGGGLALVFLVFTLVSVAAMYLSIQEVHTTDAAAVGERIKVRLAGARNIEGYFISVMRGHVCWAKFEIERAAFPDFLRDNGIGGDLKWPWGSPERVRRRYANVGIEGHQLAGAENWVLPDFEPESELTRYEGSVVFGKSATKPGFVIAYATGCPKKPR